MSAQLPPQANLRQLRNQARDLQRAHEAGEPQALRRACQNRPRGGRSSEDGRAEARLSLQDAQLVIAREYGFDSWPKLVAAVEPGAGIRHPEEELIGSSAAMQRIRADIERAAAAMVPVLLVGERGVGKRLAARCVHLGSARREGPLVQVACGATSGLLGDAELFGYEPGAFTGAHATHPGSLDAATGGTLVLGEIAGLSSDAQARLQAFMETGVYRRLGGTEELAADARVVGTSSTGLRESVAAGRFREDLYYQIEVLRIDVPPLRQRREDIPELVARLAAAVCRGRSEPVRFSAGALYRLRQHDWPGNVRELRRAVGRAVAATPGDTIPAEAVVLSVGDDAPVP